VADATQQASPSEVYVLPEMNAWVAQRGGVLGMGSGRVMGLGLPLLSRLTVAQFAAVLAHEFGHYDGGDTALGPWIYKTRAAIGRTLSNLASHSDLLMVPFQWYGGLFLRITHAISRAQEYTADALAARLAGKRALVDGLKQLEGHGAAFGGFWNQEYGPALRNGFRPPLAEGFQQFSSSEAVRSAVTRTVDEAMKATARDPFDTHPSLPDRIAALEDGPDQGRWSDPAPAITLLDEPAAVEKDLIDSLVGPEHAAKLQSVTWTEMPRLLWAPVWQRVARENADRLKDIKPRLLTDLPAKPAALAVALQFAASPDVATGEAVSKAAGVFGAGLTTVLLSQGWQISADPGHPVILRNGADEVRPFEIWSQLVNGSVSPDDWRSVCSRTGIAELDIGAQMQGPN
jgi:Zn-dependent protease with chaperone function